jgi:hypothetical protein
VSECRGDQEYAKDRLEKKKKCYSFQFSHFGDEFPTGVLKLRVDLSDLLLDLLRVRFQALNVRNRLDKVLIVGCTEILPWR